jgi:hypothetical protein
MCQFFSFVTKGDGKPIYFNAEERKALPDDVKVDSHTTIAVTKLKHVHADDKVNKYEYVNGEFVVDQINVEDDKEKAEKWITEFVKTDEFQEICLATVRKNGFVLKFVKKPTEEICLEAMRNYGLALEFVEKQTEAICLEAVRNSGWALQYVEKHTAAICLEAARSRGLSLCYVKKQNEAICLEAVRNDGLALAFVRKQTKAICLAAVRNNKKALRYVDKKFRHLFE